MKRSYVIITGASSGIGEAVVESALKNGLQPILLVREPETVAARYGPVQDQVHVFKIDLADRESILPCVEQIKDAVGKAQLKGLVNCAGINLPGPLEAIPQPRMEEQFRVNVFGPMELTRLCIPLLRKSQGSIINVGSKLARIGAPFLGPYCASKAALRRWNDSLRLELAPFGIKVTMIEPGSVKTPIWKKTLQAGKAFWESQPDSLQVHYKKRIEGTMNGANAIEEKGIPASRVGDKIIRSLVKNSSRPWIGMGKDTFMTIALAKILSIRRMDRLIVGSRTKSPKHAE